jgi:FkbM family methyltransferase
MNKIKLFLFQLLEKSLNIFSRLGINKKIPGALRIYNLLFKSFWPYKNVIEVQGSKMFIDIKEESYPMRKTFEAYALNRIHEKTTTELFKKVVKEGEVVVDLGANIGYFTLLAAKLVGKNGKVFSLEPEPRNYGYLKKNIEINDYKNVVAVQKAVSDKNGKTRLYICDYDTGHHTINKFEGVRAYARGRLVKEKSIEIETVTLDEFFKGKEELIDVIKMDVEGAEALVLAGMDNILKKNKKLQMFIEFFPLLIKKMGSSPSEFLKKLIEDYRFSISVIPDDYDAKKGEMVSAASVDEVMGFCREEEDHINLFLKHK